MKQSETLPMRQTEYLKLVDATGRQVHGKLGRIDPSLAPILPPSGSRLNIDPGQFGLSAALPKWKSTVEAASLSCPPGNSRSRT